MSLEQDYTLQEVAKALRVSTRWVRDRIRLDGVAHNRYGHLIRFTDAQVADLRRAHIKAPVTESITTGPKKRAS